MSICLHFAFRLASSKVFIIKWWTRVQQHKQLNRISRWHSSLDLLCLKTFCDWILIFTNNEKQQRGFDLFVKAKNYMDFQFTEIAVCPAAGYTDTNVKSPIKDSMQQELH